MGIKTLFTMWENNIRAEGTELSEHLNLLGKSSM